MTEFRARIGRIRMKNGGAEVRVLQRKPLNGDGDDWRGRILSHARMTADNASDDNPLTGFIVIGVFSDGSSSVGFRWDDEQCAIPRALIPSWVAEIIRRDMITEIEAGALFDRMFEYVEGGV